MQNKRGLELVNSCASGYQANSEILLYCLIKFDDVIESSFRVIPKITSANLCKLIHGIINHYTFICSIGSGKHQKEGKILQNFKCKSS